MPSVSDPADWVESAARDQSDRIFLITPDGREINYASLLELSGRFAAALIRRGVVPGDRVAVQVEKSPEAVLLYVACLRLGAAFVPINVATTANEVDYFLRDSQPRLAVIRPTHRGSLGAIAARVGAEHMETLGANGEGTLPERAEQCDARHPPPRNPGAQSPAAIVYTSGTTGRSKGATLSRANLASNAAALAGAWRFTSRDVLLHALPLFHIHGLFAAINTVLASGSSLKLLPKFDATTVLRLLPEASVFMGVPTHYTRLLRQTELN